MSHKNQLESETSKLIAEVTRGKGGEILWNNALVKCMNSTGSGKVERFQFIQSLSCGALALLMIIRSSGSG
jgi:hypothetical protein